MARTTVDIDPTVMRELKRRQQREGKTLGALVSELLASALAATSPADELRPLAWAAAPLGLKVDLDDKEAVRRLLDQK